MFTSMFIGKLDIFPLMCAAGSLNWPWSTKILGQFVTACARTDSDIENYLSVCCQTHVDVTD